MSTIINEVQFFDDEYSICRWIPVAVKQYGSAGCMPLEEKECPLKEVTSCVGSSGDNMCGGYMGHVSSNVIRCAAFPEKEKNA